MRVPREGKARLVAAALLAATGGCGGNPANNAAAGGSGDGGSDTFDAGGQASGDAGATQTDGDAGLASDTCQLGGATTPSPLCAGKTACPVVLDVDVRCGASALTAGEPSVAPGAGKGGYAMFRAYGANGRRSYLLTVDANGHGNVDAPDLPCARPASLANWAMVSTMPSGEPGIFDECATSLPQYTTDSLARVGAQWQSQWSGSGRLEGSGYAGDGRAYLLLGPDSDTASPTMLTLASRTASGTWSTSPAITTLSTNESALVIDTDGAPHAIYDLAGASAGRVAFHDTNGTADRTLLELGGMGGRVEATTTGARGAPHDAIVAVQLGGGSTPITLHVLAPSNPGYADLLVPELTPAARAKCPDPSSGVSCAPRHGSACTLTGDVNTQFALATTADGTVWLAVVVRHLDEDVSYGTTTGANCFATVVVDRSTQSLVLWRVAAGAIPGLALATQLPLATLDTLELAMGSGESRLYFAVLDITQNAPVTARYVVVDTSAVP